MSDPPVLPGPGDLGLSERRTWLPLGGGAAGGAALAVTADGREVAVKTPPYDARLEAEGLVALAQVGAPVPEVLAADAELLVMAHVAGPPDWPQLGGALARAHGADPPAWTGDASLFGWHRDNRIGPLVQRNELEMTWGTFVARRRIGALLDTPALDRAVADRLDVACEGPLIELLDAHAPRSCIVHGDLWSGNVVDGRWVIDPAVHRGDREVDLAMADLFGGFPTSFWDAYAAEAPLPDGWEPRRDVLQIWFLLVHVALFGPSWTGGVTERLDRLGW